MKAAALKILGTVMSNHYCPPAGVLFPFGHIICNEVPPHVKNLYEVPKIDTFTANVDYLCHSLHPLQVTELSDLVERKRKKVPAESFMLSFDDGMREVYEVIAPLLIEKGIRAILFINSAMIDNKQLMWRHKVSLVIEQWKINPGRIPPQLNGKSGSSLPQKLESLRFADVSVIDEVARFFDLDFDEYLRNNKPYLTTDQVMELSRAGFEIGAHSETHPHFEEIGADEQERQVFASVNFIRSLNLPCRYFAFPFHDSGASKSLFLYMKELNLDLAFGTSEGRIDEIMMSFQRFAIDGDRSRSSMSEILRTLTAKSFARYVTGTETIKRQ